MTGAALAERVGVDLSTLFASPPPPCEVSAARHEGAACAGPATHRLRTCTRSFLVCDVVAAKVRDDMETGQRCDLHREPISDVWRLHTI